MKQSFPIFHELGNAWKKPLLLVVVLLTLIWLWETPSGLLGKADAIGFALCHRIDHRTFHLGDRQLPLCARCMGMYLGAMLGLVYQNWISYKRSGNASWKIFIVLGLLVLIWAADGLNSYVSLFPKAPNVYIPNNTMRLLTGTGMGIVLSVVLFPAFNQSVWKDHNPQPAINGFLQLAVLLILGLLLDVLVLTENPLVLYPLALVSTMGALVLLTMVYTMIWLILLRAENKYSRLAELAFTLVVGFGIAMLQIGALDLVRYLLTGSWDGFYFG